MHQSMPMAAGDARGLSSDALVELRKRVVAAVEAGTAQVEVARLFGVSRQTVGVWVREYRNRGDNAFVPARRGRRPGEQLALTTAQQLWVAGTIARRTPDAVGLRYQVWTRQAVTELINREFLVMLGATTVGNYLVRWGLPCPQDLLRALRARNAVAAANTPALPEARRTWLSGAEVVWVGYGSPRWLAGRSGLPTHDETGWPDVSVLQAVSNRGAMSFLATADPFDGKEVRHFLERLISQLRRRVNIVVTWHPIRNHDAVADWPPPTESTAAVRFVSLADEHGQN
ncbi:helix-turn-helix domain-containing protein [Actinokineospora iranica]|uniref:Transposase n=1 Tax=Actinokineospora iranica TaxID=1271860 RepID=A0A1G6XEF8_9PSEU|nr:helix-turn-helix domain-containing protein [Actinokineospora iranica]SDD76163.1 Transposase [Actinokineospora iranica]